MKPTSEILERIEKCSSEHKDGVFTRLYRYLLREDIYYAAYQKLYANKGATTQGIDNDTADGFSDFYVKELIQSLKDGTYKANPVRREYIPKKNGKLRPLGIPSFHDKLLQEVVRMILEAIYEPVFDSHSHGFRPGKSCHTALRQISSDFTGVVWFIEGDIQGCFDNINHEKLIDILSRKIKDSRFLNIIRQFLKAGYIENWKYNATYSGSPQGGICSPILANIYLNELDKKFREIAERFDKPRSAYQTPEYHAASKELKRLSYWIDHTADEAARQELIDQHKQDQLDLLWQLEEFRKKHEHQAEPSDWAIRMCEAFVARSMGFTDRVQWTELLRQRGETLFIFDWKSGSVSDHVAQWCKENSRNWRYSHLGELQVAHGGEWRKVDYFCRDGRETRVYFPPESVQEQQLQALAEAPAIHVRDLLTLGLPDHDVYLVHATEDVGWVPAADLSRLTAQGKEEFSALLDAKVAAIHPGPYGVELMLDGVDPQLLVQYDETIANYSRAENTLGLFM